MGGMIDSEDIQAELQELKQKMAREIENEEFVNAIETKKKIDSILAKRKDLEGRQSLCPIEGMFYTS